MKSARTSFLLLAFVFIFMQKSIAAYKEKSQYNTLPLTQWVFISSNIACFSKVSFTELSPLHAAALKTTTQKNLHFCLE